MASFATMYEGGPDLSGAGYLTEATHHTLDDQVHALAESYVKDIIRVAGKVSEVLCRAGVIPIRRTLLTRVAGAVTQLDRVQYDAGGVESQRMTGVITRTGGKVSSVAWTHAGTP